MEKQEGSSYSAPLVKENAMSEQILFIESIKVGEDIYILTASKTMISIFKVSPSGFDLVSCADLSVHFQIDGDEIVSIHPDVNETLRAVIVGFKFG